MCPCCGGSGRVRRVKVGVVVWEECGCGGSKTLMEAVLEVDLSAFEGPLRVRQRKKRVASKFKGTDV